MTGALIAEAMKLIRHRAMWGLVWIFPLGATLIFVLGLVFHVSRGAGAFQLPAAVWIAGTTGVWKAGASGPGRFFIGAFTALAFGGEYGWNTWKLIVPHRRRLQLMVAKYAVVLGFVMLSFAIGAALSILFGALSSMVNGGAPPSGIAFGALAAAHGREALIALISTLLTMGYASAGAIILRSTMGGAIVAVGAVVVEGLAGLLAPVLNPILFLALPSYPLHDLDSWIETGVAAAQPLSSGVVQESWPIALACIGAWVIGLFAVAALTFDRQDLN